MLFPAFFISQHHISEEGLHFLCSFISLPVRPNRGGEILRIFNYIIGIGTEQYQFQFFHQIEGETGVCTDMRSSVVIVHLHPCQRVCYLTGGSDAVPRVSNGIFMVRIRRVKGCRRIEGFLIVNQIMIFQDRTEHPQFAVEEAIEHLLVHVHIGSEILHIFIQNHPLTIHKTK